MRKLNPGYTLVTIPKGTYPKQDKDVKVIGYATHIVASCKLPEDTVYAMTKAIAAEHPRRWRRSPRTSPALTPKGMAEDIGVPFHPGAAKFYKEAGVTVKTRLSDAPARLAAPAGSSSRWHAPDAAIMKLDLQPRASLFGYAVIVDLRRDGALSHVGDRLRRAGSDPVPRHAPAVRDGAGLPALPLPSKPRTWRWPQPTSGQAAAAIGLPTLARLRLLVLAALPILYLFVNYEYVVTRIFYIDDLSPHRHDHGRDHDADRAGGDAPRDRLGAADHGARVPGLRAVHRAARAGCGCSISST